MQEFLLSNVRVLNKDVFFWHVLIYFFFDGGFAIFFKRGEKLDCCIFNKTSVPGGDILWPK